jgi:hypothetical protein
MHAGVGFKVEEGKETVHVAGLRVLGVESGGGQPGATAQHCTP